MKKHFGKTCHVGTVWSQWHKLYVYMQFRKKNPGKTSFKFAASLPIRTWALEPNHLSQISVQPLAASLWELHLNSLWFCFLWYCKRVNTNTDTTGLWWGLKDLIYTKHLELCMAHTKHSFNISYNAGWKYSTENSFSSFKRTLISVSDSLDPERELEGFCCRKT